MQQPKRYATTREYLEERTAAEVMQAYAEQRDERVDPTPRPLPVVAALIERKNGQGEPEILLCRRPAHKSRGLLWEFPGGKVEPGETGEQALARECREELAVELQVGEPAAQTVHCYPDVTVQC